MKERKISYQSIDLVDSKGPPISLSSLYPLFNCGVHIVLQDLESIGKSQTNAP